MCVTVSYFKAILLLHWKWNSSLSNINNNCSLSYRRLIFLQDLSRMVDSPTKWFKIVEVLYHSIDDVIYNKNNIIDKSSARISKIFQSNLANNIS